MLKFWMIIDEALAEARRIEDSFWLVGPRRELRAISIDLREDERALERRAA